MPRSGQQVLHAAPLGVRVCARIGIGARPRGGGGAPQSLNRSLWGLAVPPVVLHQGLAGRLRRGLPRVRGAALSRRCNAPAALGQSTARAHRGVLPLHTQLRASSWSTLHACRPLSGHTAVQTLHTWAPSLRCMMLDD